jgi:hypothetical protein
MFLRSPESQWSKLKWLRLKACPKGLYSPPLTKVGRGDAGNFFVRMLKVQQKVSGSFRSDRGADAFACLRSYLSTLRKQGAALLAALETVVIGQPLYPEFA